MKLLTEADPRPESNQELLALYVDDDSVHHNSRTRKARTLTVDKFLQELDANHLNAPEVGAVTARDYLRQLQQECTRFHKTGWYSGSRCKLDLDTSNCASCPKLQTKMPSTMAQYATHLIHFYKWLHSKGWCAGNPFTNTGASFTALANQQRTGVIIVPSHDEVTRLIDWCCIHAPNRAVYYTLTYRYGLRNVEACMTSFESFNLDTGWFEVSDLRDRTESQKRKWFDYPIDGRFQRVLIAYNEWRKRHPDPDPNIVLTQYGQALNPDCFRNINQFWIQPDVTRLGWSNASRMTSHTGRRFFTTHIKNQGLEASDAAYCLLRGSRLPEQLGRYHGDQKGLAREAFKMYAP